VNFLPRLLTHNASLKFAALVAAIFLWAITPAEREQQESLTSIPVRVQVADLDWTLAEEPLPAEVDVRLSGPAQEILRLTREGATVRVPVESVTGEDTTISLRRDWVTLGTTSGLVVDEILPTSVQLRFEPVRSADLPVALRTEGDLPDDLALTAPIEVVPEVVRARGPSRLLDARDSVRTRPLQLQSVSGSGRFTLPVDTLGFGAALLDPREIQVTLDLVPAVELELPDVPVRLVGPGASEYEVRPGVLPMMLRGAAARLGDFDPSVVAWEVDTRGIGILAVGELRTVAVTPAGVPPLLRAVTRADSVVVSRPDVDEGGDR